MKKLFIGSLATTLLVSGAIGLHAYAQEDNGKLENKQLASISKSPITEQEAIVIAQKQVDGEVTRIKLDSDDGRYEYEVDLQNDDGEYDIKIDATTGKVLEQEWDAFDNKAVAKTSANQTLITQKEAIAIAKKQVNGEVTEIELDKDDNRYEYEIELRTNKGEADITIDASTGKVLELDLDDDGYDD
ncbi:PepSY domain-containing protein [Psychrobacillus sp. NEAU-3TGS]|uniref:PepSY domain-containing protein n=1 Tax=Psychrobacillus sp. NEAU-3TGS TaxID=2995412 RepID=UPI00249AE89D|nr:PepSY domain-containing protein [Psychrobacillus sp. NEAU-3TGS]